MLGLRIIYLSDPTTYIETEPGPDFERKSDVQDWQEHLESDSKVDIVLKASPVRHVPCLRRPKKVEAIGLPNLGETAKHVLGVQFTADEGASDVDVALAVLGKDG